MTNISCSATETIVPIILVSKDSEGNPVWEQIGLGVSGDPKIDHLKAIKFVEKANDQTA